MKILSFLIIGFLSSFASEAAEPVISRLEVHQGSINQSQKSLLFTHIDTVPANVAYEYAVDVELDGQVNKAIVLTPNEVVSLSPQDLSIGSHTWAVRISLIEKEIHKNYCETVSFYENEIKVLEKKRDHETDPQKIADLQSQIDRDHDLIDVTKEVLENTKRVIETKSIVFNVMASLQAMMLISDANLFSLETDHHGGPYSIGERSTITATINTDFIGEDGPVENLIKATLANTALGIEKLDSRTFKIKTAIFSMADLGFKQIHVSYWIRSQAKADNLRNATQSAIQKRAQLIALRDAETDPDKITYLQIQIDELSLVISEISILLDQMLISKQEKDISIVVNAMQAVEL